MLKKLYELPITEKPNKTPLSDQFMVSDVTRFFSSAMFDD